MLRLLNFLLITIVVASCASQKDLSPYASRTLASTPVFREFLERIAKGTSNKYSAAMLEKEILKYIKNKPSKSAHGNWSHLGLSQDEVKNIQSLNDDHVYMPKVRKWIAENLTRIIPKLQKKNIANAFEVFMNTGRYAHNPYKGSKSIAAHASSRRRSIKPSEQYVIPDQQVRVLKGINSHPVAIKKVYRDSMSVFMKRGKANPSIRQNGLEIVESASEITRLTGLKGMGTGCQKFAKTAPESVLASKANVDTYRMLKVKEAQSFKKVTQEDLDEITVEAFKKVQGHTDEEARTIVKMLKRAPCSHY